MGISANALQTLKSAKFKGSECVASFSLLAHFMNTREYGFVLSPRDTGTGNRHLSDVRMLVDSLKVDINYQ